MEQKKGDKKVKKGGKAKAMEEAKAKSKNGGECAFCADKDKDKVKMSKLLRLSKTKRISSSKGGFYLAAPESIEAVYEEFLLVPADHKTGINVLDNVKTVEQREIMDFLIGYFKKQDKLMIFIEVALPKEMKPHTVLYSNHFFPFKTTTLYSIEYIVRRCTI